MAAVFPFGVILLAMVVVAVAIAVDLILALRRKGAPRGFPVEPLDVSNQRDPKT